MELESQAGGRPVGDEEARAVEGDGRRGPDRGVRQRGGDRQGGGVEQVPRVVEARPVDAVIAGLFEPHDQEHAAAVGNRGQLGAHRGRGDGLVEVNLRGDHRVEHGRVGRVVEDARGHAEHDPAVLEARRDGGAGPLRVDEGALSVPHARGPLRPEVQAARGGGREGRAARGEGHHEIARAGRRGGEREGLLDPAALVREALDGHPPVDREVAARVERAPARAPRRRRVAADDGRGLEAQRSALGARGAARRERRAARLDVEPEAVGGGGEALASGDEAARGAPRSGSLGTAPRAGAGVCVARRQRRKRRDHERKPPQSKHRGMLSSRSFASQASSCCNCSSGRGPGSARCSTRRCRSRPTSRCSP